MSFGDYAIGFIGLAAFLIPLGWAAARVRRALLLPGWDGATGALADAIAAIAAITIAMQILGAIGVLFAPVMIAVSLLAALAAARMLRPEGVPAAAIAADDPGGRWFKPPAPAQGRIATAIAIAAAVFVAAHWATGVQDVWGRGIFTFDGLWYHGPFSARIAAEGSFWPLHFTDPRYLNWFYPQNSELHHAAGMIMFGRDIASPLLNVGWLGLALLAGWCIGRPYGVAPLSAIAVAIVLDTGPMVPREAGTFANDVAPVALLLATAAILINAYAAKRREAGTGALIVAGLALGLALGTKLTVAGPAAAMLIGVLVIARPGTRRRALWIFGGAVAATCGIWFLRNLIHSGSPLPWTDKLGPIDLPGPGRGLEGRDPYAISHYIFTNPDRHVWLDWFLPGVENLFGPLWFALLGLTGVGAVVAVWRGNSPAVKLAGAVAGIGAIAYVFTPLTAAGPEGEPAAFTINLRYLLPSMSLALALLPLHPRLAPARARWPLALGGLGALLITSRYSDSAAIWTNESLFPHTQIPYALMVGAALIGLPAIIAVLGHRSVRLGLAAGTVALFGVGAAGFATQDSYLDSRYTGHSDFRFQVDEAARWAKPTAGLRIGLVGTTGGYSQYVLYGDRLDNEVQYVGVTGPGGDFTAAQRCPEFRRALNAGNYDYLVTSSDLDLNSPGIDHPAPERSWVRGSDQAELVLGGSRLAIFRLSGQLAPGGCPGRDGQPQGGAKG